MDISLRPQDIDDNAHIEQTLIVAVSKQTFKTLESLFLKFLEYLGILSRLMSIQAIEVEDQGLMGLPQMYYLD